MGARTAEEGEADRPLISALGCVATARWGAVLCGFRSIPITDSTGIPITPSLRCGTPGPVNVVPAQSPKCPSSNDSDVWFTVMTVGLRAGSRNLRPRPGPLGAGVVTRRPPHALAGAARGRVLSGGWSKPGSRPIPGRGTRRRGEEVTAGLGGGTQPSSPSVRQTCRTVTMASSGPAAATPATARPGRASTSRARRRPSHRQPAPRLTHPRNHPERAPGPASARHGVGGWPPRPPGMAARCGPEPPVGSRWLGGRPTGGASRRRMTAETPDIVVSGGRGYTFCGFLLFFLLGRRSGGRRASDARGTPSRPGRQPSHPQYRSRAVRNLISFRATALAVACLALPETGVRRATGMPMGDSRRRRTTGGSSRRPRSRCAQGVARRGEEGGEGGGPSRGTLVWRSRMVGGDARTANGNPHGHTVRSARSGHRSSARPALSNAKRNELDGTGGAPTGKGAVVVAKDRATGQVAAWAIETTDAPTLRGFVDAHPGPADNGRSRVAS